MNFRRATMADADLLFAWRNDAHTRAMSHDGREIAFSDHLAWLDKSLTDARRDLFVCQGDAAAPIGVIRRDDEGALSVLSWTLNPDYRGRGLGKAMLWSFVTRYPGRYRAEVKASNVASQKMCVHAGFRLGEEKGGIFHFYREAPRPPK
ncbi:GNAT family N-acetyltransferase [Varunaivibrio sulfuroxidans]|uniref:RimJ/RimL family protein N-acetyltransferase n=1 Tax=Varunaivibrio sulfuroxidans TaxID=1773489 RepID=A0A4R3J6Y3_9PROT|nr:GNAT family N-acetyltransferase [Varunaivibrio sulfuroxidans]TCS61608.1 RimJ/RimL family protein N-acetyltransferase [Varunaivibrio sulfuroxidans]WES29517.1 GNAT family N-acetyltransferase [Varunaivibrio sulfuroxidans]